MGDTRPKLLIVGSSGIPGDDLRQRLSSGYDVSIVQAGALLEALRDQHVSILVGPPAELASSRSGLGEAVAAALLDSTGYGACLTWPDGSVFWANTQFRAYDDSVRARISEAAREVARDSVTEPGDPASGRVQMATADDSRAYEALLSPLRAEEASQAEAVAVVVRDITDERRVLRKLEAIDRSGSELVSLDTETIRGKNVFERLTILEEKIISLCRDLLHFDHFAIRLIDEKTGRLEMVVSSGLPQEVGELEIYPRPEGNGISGWVAATGQSYICTDTQTDRLFLPGLAGARSSVTVPLRLRDRVVGTFDVESTQPGAFDEEDRRFAEIFGRHVALALHMLDLLVVERSSTNATVTSRVAGEISEPLTDILSEAEWLKDLAQREPDVARHVEKIRADVLSIRQRLENVTSGPQTLLGVEKAMSEIRPEPLLEGRLILVADDEPNMRRVIHDILRNRGCVVATFESGVGAIAALEQAAAGERPRFDVVLSDIKMPDRNGYEVFAAARRCLPGVPVILMTGFGYDPHHSIVRASQEGLQAVLFKPFPVERLLDEVRKAVTPGG
jgi:CheY-like chemotaxis protein/GAF domain-containing protein